MRIVGLIIFVIISFTARAQWKSYQIELRRKDTVNRIDMNNLKQGKWIIRYDEVRGEPGFQEEGNFKDDLREGEWKQHNLMGDPIGEENYRYGQKDGKQLYYDISGNLRREETWKAITPDNMYDTVLAPDWKKDPTGTTMKNLVIKLDGNAVRNGDWKYYDLQARLVRTEKYIYDKMVESLTIDYDPIDGKVVKKEKLNYDMESGKQIASAAYEKPKADNRPQQVIDFEKQKGKKKGIKFKDGSTGG
jgi:antitoxin component YwqK of YwqJK toxin-antitoxin module